jgi:hypothetical protein
MLGFLFRLVTDLRRDRARMNPDHYQELLQNLADMKGEQNMARFLMMDILISTESAHPDGSRTKSARQETVAM